MNFPKIPSGDKITNNHRTFMVYESKQKGTGYLTDLRKEFPQTEAIIERVSALFQLLNPRGL